MISVLVSHYVVHQTLQLHGMRSILELSRIWTGPWHKNVIVWHSWSDVIESSRCHCTTIMWQTWKMTHHPIYCYSMLEITYSNHSSTSWWLKPKLQLVHKATLQCHGPVLAMPKTAAITVRKQAKVGISRIITSEQFSHSYSTRYSWDQSERFL